VVGGNRAARCRSTGRTRALAAVEEDQHAGVPRTEIAGAIELQLLAVMKCHFGAPGAKLFLTNGRDRGDQAERNV
jgi:hypothetical protein